MTDKNMRNAKIVADFAKGGVTKAALARKYGVDEKTVRRAIKNSGVQAAPVKVKQQGTVGKKDVKASVKAKAKKAVGGVPKSVKATTQISAQKVSVTAPTQEGFKVGDEVRMSTKGRHNYVNGDTNPHNLTGKIHKVETSSSDWRGIIVNWSNGKLNSYFEDELEMAVGQKAEPAPVQTGVKAALQAGKAVEYVITGDSIMLTLGDDVEIVDSTHQNYKLIKQAIVAEDYKTAYDLMNISKAINTFTKGAIRVENGELYYGEMRLKSTLVDRILALMADGDEGFKRLVNFLERLLNNPSRRSVEELWGFISHLDVEIDSDGYIIGWKNVNNKNGHLVDCHTGKVPNDVGNIVEMPRHMVNDNKDQTCSQGLHVAAWGYLRHFSGDVTLKVKVDPADVVSIPTDYKDMKMRAAKYEVLDTVDSNRKHVNVPRAADVKRLHVKVGQAGQILEAIEI